MKHIQLACILIFFGIGSVTASIRNDAAATVVIDHLLDSAEDVAGTDEVLATQLVQRAEEYAKNLGLDFEYARAQFSKGYIKQVNSGGEIGVVSYFNAATLLEDIDSQESKRLSSVTHKNIAKIFSSYFQYDKAIEHYHKSYLFAKEIDDTELERSALYFKARALRKKGEYLLAIDDMFEASEIALEEEDFTFLIKVNNQLGLLFKDVGDYEKAIEHYFEVFVYKNKNVKIFPSYAGRSYHNLANIYLLQGDYEKAEEYFLKSISTRLEANIPKSTFYSYMDLAELYARQGKLELAEEFYQNAIDLEVAMKGKPDKFKIYKQMADLAILQNNVEMFMQHSGEYTAFLEKDLFKNIEVTQIEQQNTINLVTERYYQLMEAKQREEDMRQLGIWVAIISLLSLASYITFTKVRAYRNKKLLEKELKEVMVDLNLDDL